jgi:hypothetical protein
VEPDRVFVNLFPDEVKTGMAEHEDVAVFCTVIIMLTQDDDNSTALQMGHAGKYGSLFICSGDLVVFRNIRHELPACIRRRKRLTINLFF